MRELRRQTPSATTHPALEKLRQSESEERPAIRKLGRKLNCVRSRAYEHAQDPHVKEDIIVPVNRQVIGRRTLGVADGEVRHRAVSGRQGNGVSFGLVARAVGISG
jgi:hypothetical protein